MDLRCLYMYVNVIFEVEEVKQEKEKIKRFYFVLLKWSGKISIFLYVFYYIEEMYFIYKINNNVIYFLRMFWDCYSRF